VQTYGVDVVRSVVDLVRSWGFDVHQPISLRSTNNVVLWLSPSPLVAKLSKEHERANRELAVVRELVKVGAPVVPPFELGVEQPVTIDDKTVTFWRYEPQDTVIELRASEIAEYLYRLHTLLASIWNRNAFPSYVEPLMSAISALERSDLVPGLVNSDRTMLRETLVDGIARLAQLVGGPSVIHGSPHRLNILTVDAHPKFIDFESVEFGPLEWDLAHLEPEVAAYYRGELDQPALLLCRVLVSAATSTWCWQGLARGIDMQSHAQYHLEVVRSTRS
jgi:hypothetical protein